MLTDAAYGRPDSDADASTLDRRRERRQAAMNAAAAAADRFVVLDAELASNAGQHRNDDAGLQAARPHVAALKTTIKAAAVERDRLRAARTNAGRRAAKATRRAAAAEVKYDRAVLADMVRREKAHDLSAHPDDHTTATNGGGPRQSATTTRARSETHRGCGCPKPAHMSCDVLVFVEENADAIVSVDLADLGRCAAGEWS